MRGSETRGVTVREGSRGEGEREEVERDADRQGASVRTTESTSLSMIWGGAVVERIGKAATSSRRGQRQRKQVSEAQEPARVRGRSTSEISVRHSQWLEFSCSSKTGNHQTMHNYGKCIAATG
jgi:hypothetical protein